MTHSRVILCCVPVLLAAACGDDPHNVIHVNPNDTAMAQDTTPPEIEHTPVSGSQMQYEAVTIEAVIIDEEGRIMDAEVWYTQQTSTTFQKASLQATGPDGQYVGEIPASAVYTAGMRYYLRAQDDSRNEGFLPIEAEEGPFTFPVTADD